MEWELGGFFCVEGLDKRICWGFDIEGKKMRGSLHSASLRSG